LKYDHYGDDSKVSSNNGDMDMRATVAVMDRNIQIITPKECAYLLEIVWTLQLTQMSLLDVENTE